METLYRLELDNNKWVFNKGFININNNKTVKINYINDITEQDYDGTYTDTICVVNLDNIVSGSLTLKDITNDDNVILSIAGTNIREKLWGWTEYDMNNIVSKILNKNSDDIKPIDDNGIGDLICDDNYNDDKDNNDDNDKENEKIEEKYVEKWIFSYSRNDFFSTGICEIFSLFQQPLLILLLVYFVV